MLKLIIRLAYFAVIFVEGLIISNVVLTLINASKDNQLVSWILDTSVMFISPFEGIMTNSIEINNMQLPLTPVVALFFFIIAGFILSELLKSFSRE